MTYGTAYFVTKAAAVRYYRPYEPEASKAVERKLAEGQIHIGIPELRDGQSCYLNAEEGRYFIEEPDLKPWQLRWPGYKTATD